MSIEKESTESLDFLQTGTVAEMNLLPFWLNSFGSLQTVHYDNTWRNLKSANLFPELDDAYSVYEWM